MKQPIVEIQYVVPLSLVNHKGSNSFFLYALRLTTRSDFVVSNGSASKSQQTWVLESVQGIC